MYTYSQGWCCTKDRYVLDPAKLTRIQIFDVLCTFGVIYNFLPPISLFVLEEKNKVTTRREIFGYSIQNTIDRLGQRRGRRHATPGGIQLPR